MKKVKFYGGLYLEPNGTLVATKNPDEPLYIGPPSQEIDDAWQALVHGMVSLTGTFDLLFHEC
jgi:hypothetical protein